MMCYRDRSFCSSSSECINRACWRLLTPENTEDAKRMKLDIGYVDYKDVLGECMGFIRKQDDSETEASQ